MLNRRLHPDEWRTFFDGLSNRFRQDDVQRYVMLRASTPEMMGSRDVTPWLEFERISYDPATHTLHVHLDGFQYQIAGPVIIWAAIAADGNVERLVVLRRGGSRDYVDFSKHRFPYNAVPFFSRPGSLRLFGADSHERPRRKKTLWKNLLQRRKAS